MASSIAWNISWIPENRESIRRSESTEKLGPWSLEGVSDEWRFVGGESFLFRELFFSGRTKVDSEDCILIWVGGFVICELVFLLARVKSSWISAESNVDSPMEESSLSKQHSSTLFSWTPCRLPFFAWPDPDRSGIFPERLDIQD